MEDCKCAENMFKYNSCGYFLYLKFGLMVLYAMYDMLWDN